MLRLILVPTSARDWFLLSKRSMDELARKDRTDLVTEVRL